LDLILALRTNFKYRFMSLSLASSTFMPRNFANVGNGRVNSLTHGGYSFRDNATGALDGPPSFGAGYILSRPGMGDPGFIAIPRWDVEEKADE
jgi:hypothetical protein